MKRFCYSILLLFLVTSLQAQLTPQQAVAEMGRGINLGNTLEPPLEGAWNNGPAEESYFDAYAAAGFNNVRVPVRWDQHTSNSAPFAIDSSWMNRVEQVVDWGLSRGFYITLNGHHEDWLKTNYSNATLRARYDSIWVQVAERFKNKSEKLLFEIINEPNGMTVSQVDDLNQRILGIIRKSNPTRIVIYSGNMYSNSEQLLQAAIPNDDYLIGYYHAYDPWRFSGQGNGTWGTPNEYQQITNKYNSVKAWSTANNIPIHHSEFGAILSCDFNSRMRIYAHNVEQCIINGFAFSVWDDGGDFRVLNRSNNSWPEIKDVLMHYHEDSPNQILSSFTTDTSTQSASVLVTWDNRTTSNDSIVMERSVGASSTFAQIATLSPTATTYTDNSAEIGKTYTYRMYTYRSDSTLLHGYPSRVSIPASIQTPFTTPIPIPGNLEVEEFDNGGEGLAYHDNEPTNIPGGFRLDEGVDIGTFGNGYILEYVVDGEWIEYTVDIQQAGMYSIQAELASEASNGGFTISFAQNNKSASFSSPNTGSWTAFQTVSASQQIELEAGVQEMRLTIDNNNPFNIDKLIFTLESATSNNPLEEVKTFSIAPNPSNGVIQFELAPQFVAKDVQIEVYQLTGEKIASYSATGISTSLDLGELARGMYWIRASGEGLNASQRVIIR
ncbi:MAG: cellulase family glycosylhydrolase [Bacteroidota bacterium]